MSCCTCVGRRAQATFVAERGPGVQAEGGSGVGLCGCARARASHQVPCSQGAHWQTRRLRKHGRTGAVTPPDGQRECASGQPHAWSRDVTEIRSNVLGMRRRCGEERQGRASQRANNKKKDRELWHSRGGFYWTLPGQRPPYPHSVGIGLYNPSTSHWSPFSKTVSPLPLLVSL
jgi:hypothetical protein